ncbi:MAG: hypothetical protein EOO77_31960, partial [Oxalobacteraceae bacterium]
MRVRFSYQGDGRAFVIRTVISAAALLAGGVALASTLSTHAASSEAVTVVDVPRTSTLPASSFTTTQWVNCGGEGQSCTVPGSTLVRYGAGDTVVIKEISGSFVCGNTMFGDPAYGVVKSCSYSPAPAASEWTLCASESQTCITPDVTMVRYGANGRFAFKDAISRTACSNEVFGDPVYGIAKACAYRAIASTPSADHLSTLTNNTNDPPVLIPEPTYIRDTKAIGSYWDVPGSPKDSAQAQTIENNMKFLIEFYEGQVEQRRWYG